MARYVDGYVIPLPRRNLPKYRRIAAIAGRVWREHGALRYVECVGDHLDTGCGTPFPELARAKRGETVVFAFVVFRSRAHRDRVNAKAVKDPRLARYVDPKAHPFDPERMTWGGFRTIVDA